MTVKKWQYFSTIFRYFAWGNISKIAGIFPLINVLQNTIEKYLQVFNTKNMDVVLIYLFLSFYIYNLKTNFTWWNVIHVPQLLVSFQEPSV